MVHTISGVSLDIRDGHICISMNRKRRKYWRRWFSSHMKYIPEGVFEYHRGREGAPCFLSPSKYVDVRYSPSHYHRKTIDRILNHIVNLLRSIPNVENLIPLPYQDEYEGEIYVNHDYYARDLFAHAVGIPVFDILRYTKEFQENERSALCKYLGNKENYKVFPSGSSIRIGTYNSPLVTLTSSLTALVCDFFFVSLLEKHNLRVPAPVRVSPRGNILYVEVLLLERKIYTRNVATYYIEKDENVCWVSEFQSKKSIPVILPTDNYPSLLSFERLDTLSLSCRISPLPLLPYRGEREGKIRNVCLPLRR